MGGIGSGRGSSWPTKTTTEGVKKIDVRYMSREGFLKDGAQGQLAWSKSGKPCGNIDYKCSNGSLILNYRFREHGGEWQFVNQSVPVVYTSCNYGGGRPWFLCPRCSKRVAILYGADKLFLCRHCYQLPYDSQQRGNLDRLIDKKHKLGEAIFQHYEYGEGWGKKKGLHWKTYNKLLKKYEDTEAAYLSLMANRLGLKP